MNLTPVERMNLLRFVCSFAWTDLKVATAERDLVMRIAGRLGLSDSEVAQVARWLQVPPPPEEVDPRTVPLAHRKLFFGVAELVAKADGRVVPAERDSLALFRALLQE